MSDNLWPTDFGVLLAKTPISILREQGAALGERTANVVVGRAMTQAGTNGQFQQVFVLYCAPLSYSVHLLTVTHGIDLYPAQISVEGVEEVIIANNSDELAAHLKAIFSRERTRTIIASLIAQSKQ